MFNGLQTTMAIACGCASLLPSSSSSGTFADEDEHSMWKWYWHVGRVPYPMVELKRGVDCLEHARVGGCNGPVLVFSNFTEETTAGTTNANGFTTFGTWVDEWTIFKDRLNFVKEATVLLDCDSNNPSVLGIKIRYPWLFHGQEFNDIKTNMTELLQKPWRWNPPGGFVSHRGCQAGFNDWGFNSRPWNGVDYVYSTRNSFFDWCFAKLGGYGEGGGAFSHWIFKSNDLCDPNTVAWNKHEYWDPVPGATGDGNKNNGGTWKWKFKRTNPVTWNQLDGILQGCVLSNATLPFNQWNTQTLNEPGKRKYTRQPRTWCGASYTGGTDVHAISVHSGTIGIYQDDANCWSYYSNNKWSPILAGMSPQRPVTCRADIYDAFDRIPIPSESSKITSGDDNYPGAIQLDLSLELWYGVPKSDEGVHAGAPITLTKSLVDQWLEGPGSEFKNIGTKNGNTFTITADSHGSKRIDDISKLLYNMRSTGINFPIDLSTMPEGQDFDDVAFHWKFRFKCLNGAVVIYNKKENIPLFTNLKGAFNNNTTWHDINFSTAAGTDLNTSGQTVICQSTSGGSNGTASGSVYGTCATSVNLAYTRTATAVFDEVRTFATAFNFVRDKAGSLITSISKFITTLKGNAAIYNRVLTEPQRAAITTLQSQLPNIVNIFTAANSEIGRISSGLFDQASILNGKNDVSKLCQQRTTIDSVQDVRDSVKNAYAQITTLFTTLKTAFSDIDIPLTSGIPNVQSSLSSINQKLANLTDGLSPLDTSADKLNPSQLPGTTPALPGETDAGSGGKSSSSSSKMTMYIGIVAALIVGILVWWYFFKKPKTAAGQVYAQPAQPAPVVYAQPAYAQPAPVVYAQPAPPVVYAQPA